MMRLWLGLIFTFLSVNSFAQTNPSLDNEPTQRYDQNGKVLNQIETPEGEGTLENNRQSQIETLREDAEDPYEDTGDIYSEEEEW